MKNLKKALAILLVVAISVSAGILGTIAYLTDTEEKVNVMTVGSIDIELLEHQRNVNGTELVDFEQGKTMMPLVGSAQGEKDGFGLIKQALAKNYVDKIVRVENTGKNPAYVRVYIAFPAALDADNASDMIVHWNYSAYFNAKGNDGTVKIEDKYAPVAAQVTDEDNNPVVVTIDGEVFNLYSFTYNEILAAGETTAYPAITGIYLDSRVDYDDEAEVYTFNGNKIDYDLSKGVYMPVFAQAIQAEGFADAAAAFAALGDDISWIADTKLPADPSQNQVAVTAENLDSVDFTQDNATFVLSGNFDEPLTISVVEGLTQVYDASAANFADEGTVTINAPGVAHAYSSLNAERKGNVTVKGFEVGTLNVLAYNNETVTISDNKVNSMSVIGGNFALVIDGNLVDGNFGQYTDGENQTNEYGISMRITDYELSVTNNTITETYSHAIGINGRQGEASSDWGNCGENNKITVFSGNNITLNTTEKTGRGALKIWNDQVYAPYATSGQEPSEAAKALMADILADTTNVFTLGAGHTIFNIFDYTTSDGK